MKYTAIDGPLKGEQFQIPALKRGELTRIPTNDKRKMAFGGGYYSGAFRVAIYAAIEEPCRLKFYGWQ